MRIIATLRRYEPIIVTAISSLGVTAITGLAIVTYTSASTSSKILARQDRLITDVSRISTVVRDLQTRTEADKQYNQLDNKIENKYGELKDFTIGLDNRVRTLEMNQ
jgi:hypothetical protein